MSTVASVLDDGPAGTGGQTRFWRCFDERAEAHAVATDIERLVFRKGVAPRRIAVLLPSAQGDARELLAALQERAIPHRPHGAAAMLARAEVRDALAWMRLLVDPGDAGAAVRVLIRAPVEMRHVDLAQVVQIARRRRLDVVSALPRAIESPQMPPEARERIHRFLALHGEVALALAEMPPDSFVDHLLELIRTTRGGSLVASSEAAERGASLAWLQAQARSFCRRYPWADGRELVLHLLDIAKVGQSEAAIDPNERLDEIVIGPGAAEAALALAAEEGPDGGLVQLLPIGLSPGAGIDHAYLLGLRAGKGQAGKGQEEPGQEGLGQAAEEEGVGQEGRNQADIDAALIRLAQLGCEDIVLSYPVAQEEGEGASQPQAQIERMRLAMGAVWEEMSVEPADLDQTIEAALRAMRQELLDGVASIGGRLRELRLDTDIDVSHGIVRYLELVKLAALLERPAGQSVAEALDDVNARLLPAVTPMQREILESSTLDEELLAGRALANAAPALGRTEAGEPSLQRFLPRRHDGLLLSASDIETYRSCPLRYKFTRVLRIPAQTTVHQRFGIALHQVLERYHAQGQGTLDQLLRLLDECWRRAGLPTDPQRSQLLEKATTALRRYHERLAEQRSEPVWFERMFSFKLGRHHVRGRVDRVDRLPDGSYELIDYKTGRPKDEQQLRQDVQLSLYAIAAQECWQLETSRQAYYYLLDDVKVPLPSIGGGAEWVRQTAVEIAEEILQERFEPTPSPHACGLCDYRILCPVAEG